MFKIQYTDPITNIRVPKEQRPVFRQHKVRAAKLKQQQKVNEKLNVEDTSKRGKARGIMDQSVLSARSGHCAHGANTALAACPKRSYCVCAE